MNQQHQHPELWKKILPFMEHTIKYKPRPLTELAEAIRHAVGICNLTGQAVELKFNQHTVIVEPGFTVENVQDQFDQLAIAEAREGAGRKPDPEALGRELATHLKRRWDNVPSDNGILEKEYEETIIESVIELSWERDFWRAKALGEEPKL